MKTTKRESHKEKCGRAAEAAASAVDDILDFDAKLSGSQLKDCLVAALLMTWGEDYVRGALGRAQDWVKQWEREDLKMFYREREDSR